MVEIILSAITFFFNSFLGLFVFYRNPKSWTSRFFFLLTLLINAYLVINYISLNPPTHESQIFWIRMVMFICSFIGPTLLLLVVTFPQAKSTLRVPYRIGLFLLCASSAIASLSPYVFTSLQFPQGKPVPTPGPAIPLFFSDFAGLFILSFVLLIIKYKKSSGVQKIQFFYFLLGILGTFSLMAITTIVFVVILKYSDLVFLGPISTLFLIVCLAYAIVRHKFLDTRLIVARSIAYTLVFVLMAVGYAIMIVGVSLFFLNLSFSPQQYLFFGFLVLVSSFAFHPLQRRLEDTTDRLFYKGYYNVQEFLQKMADIMAANINLGTITHQLLDTIMLDLRITRGYFILLKSNGVDEVSFIKGKESDPDIQIGYAQLAPFFIKKEISFFDEIEDTQLKDILRHLNVTVVLPLFVKEENIGILCLGEKLSGDIYQQQDQKVLEILQPELSVAIQNSREYEEIKRFNITLKQEVESATKDLQNANVRLQELDKLKDEFVSLASHELRTPLTAIKSYLWEVLNKPELGELTEKQKLYLDRTYGSTTRLIHLVNDMLNVSRIESGRMIIEQKLVDIPNMINAVVNEILPSAQENDLTISVQTANPEVLPKGFIDEDKIKEVLMNLIGNSLKFTPPKGTIIITCTLQSTMLCIAVQDTGKGVKKEDMGKLFTKFGMIQSTYAVRPEMHGTGLGLYICKSIVEMHHGTITITSDGEDKGTIVSFTIPIATQ